MASVQDRPKGGARKVVVATLVQTELVEWREINPKQYKRILKRRVERATNEHIRPHLPRQPYLHESRHRHAVNRQRGQKGRFANRAPAAPGREQLEALDFLNEQPYEKEAVDASSGASRPESAELM
ncbi:hypothetical protein EMIHUDRAFT_196450 [Emiliania huxleyi CCMP1516]|uniref:Nuclear transcription factor Y subunit n=2 Tax=Emiliania huxleyi TaxID=2903 RepID=A0A0D3J446_EMIH1|nr:hypothetical protein EMIHUDRAFT_196450 [Emiliania huxleyi CCMP1516]EOD18281.1 hypothetical protein EMIHUDRAFT_196450 [Emiliania huxleyi CCMP1516]|eukprot:XP_005770710.1 hypothetical protein EMIHUDRAFT_196450 [Emiliania huxleyi CCMP1516]